MAATADQLIGEWLLAPASVPDPQVVDTLVEDCRELTVIGDKIYNHAGQEDHLWQHHHILLLPLRKKNQKHQWPDEVHRAQGRVRHRVETVVGMLTKTFNVQRPRGRTLAGHVVRIATCMLAHTLCFFLA